MDVWALGCLLYGLMYFKHPFMDAGTCSALLALACMSQYPIVPPSGPLGILSAKYKIPPTPVFPAPLNTCLRACLQLRPQDRPAAAQVRSVA